MDDEQLRAALRQRGIDIPITSQTRSVLLKKVQSGGILKKRAGHSLSSGAGTSTVTSSNSQKPPDSRQQQRCASQEASSASLGASGSARGAYHSASTAYTGASAPASLACASTIATRTEKRGSLRTSADLAACSTAASAANADLSADLSSVEPEPEVGDSEWEHRCRIAEQQLAQLQREMAASRSTSAASEEHVRLLRENMQRMVNQPSLISDTCFLAGHGVRILANRAVCAMRCESMVSILWREDKLAIQIKSPDDQVLTVVDVCLDHSVRAVKELIASQTGVAAHLQRLVHESKELENERVLSEYGIQQQSCIQLERSSVSDEDADDAGATRPGNPCRLVCVVDMPDIAGDSLAAFLAYLYSADVQVSADNVCGVFVLARRFDMSLLRKECVEFMGQRMDAQNVWELLRMAHSQRSDELLLVSLQFVARHGGLQQLEHSVPEIAAELVQFWALHQL